MADVQPPEGEYDFTLGGWVNCDVGVAGEGKVYAIGGGWLYTEDSARTETDEKPEMIGATSSPPTAWAGLKQSVKHHPVPQLKWLATPLLLAQLGCSPELTRDDAKTLIEEHVLRVVPDWVPTDTLGIAIEEVLQIDEFSREVRFLWADSSEMSVFFQRSDEGWALVRYGPVMIRQMSRIVGVSWGARYQPLLRVLDAINRGVGDAWEMDMMNRYSAAFGAGRRDEGTRLFEMAESGPHEDELRDLVDSAAITIPPDLEWHYSRGTYSIGAHANEAPMLWVTRSDDPDVVCASKFALSTADPPFEFFGVDENYCGSRGRWSLTSRRGVVDRAEATAREIGTLNRTR